MKRIGLVLVLFLIVATSIGCKGGDGGSDGGSVTISISPQDVTLLLGQEATFNAVVTGLSDQRVTWSATGGEIDEDGRYVATEVGIFEVIATSKAKPSKSAKTKVYVIAPERVEEFYEINAWQGSITWRVNASWSSTDEASQKYNHLCKEDITLKYLLDEKYYNRWCRRSDSPIAVSGSIHGRSEKAPGDKDYVEMKWNGQFTFVPESGTHSDYLEIDDETGTYSIYLENQSIDPSPIETRLYKGGDLEESWKNWGFSAFRIENQPLPFVGTTLSGSKVEKWTCSPMYYGPGAFEEKETDVTITWRFEPVE